MTQAEAPGDPVRPVAAQVVEQEEEPMRTARSRVARTAATAVAMALALVLILAAIPFRYYDNGLLVRTRLGAIYLRELRGYGRQADPRCGLGPGWGLVSCYAARNFTLHLWGLTSDHGQAWDDILAGPGLVLYTLAADGERTPVAVYADAGRLPAGRKVTLQVMEVRRVRDPGAAWDREVNVPRYALTLLRLPLTSVGYVLEIEDLGP